MDCSALLKAQQQDFYNRLKIGHLLISQTNNYCAESYSLLPEVIKKIKLESVAEAKKIIDNKGTNISPQKICSLLFYRYLAKESVLSQFNNLTYLEFSQEGYSQSHLNSCSFKLKNNPQTKVLLKFYLGDLENIDLTISAEELAQYQLFVFTSFPHNKYQKEENYQIIFLGFIPSHLFVKSSEKINIKVQDLLYIGGFNYYINNKLYLADDNLFTSAKEQMKQGKYYNSLKIFNQIIEQNKQEDKYYFLRGICQYKLGNKTLALQDLQQVTKLNQLNLNAYHWQGFIYQQLREYQKAIDAYTQEIKIDNLNFFAYFQRALVSTKLNQFISAIDDYTIALKITSHFFQTYYNRAYLYFLLGDKQSAIEDYQKAIHLKPDLYQAHYNLAIIYQQLGNYQQAIKEYQSTIKINPQYIKSYYNLAILLSNLGLYNKAINYYKESLKIDPNFIQSTYNYESLIALLNNNNILLNKLKFLNSSEDKPQVMKIEDPNSTVVVFEDQQNTISSE
jgi:tetratricopeptide (TPR) repeat protein